MASSLTCIDDLLHNHLCLHSHKTLKILMVGRLCCRPTLAAGFDVWMLNHRGNDFSRGNLHYSHTEAEYWWVLVCSDAFFLRHGLQAALFQ